MGFFLFISNMFINFVLLINQIDHLKIKVMLTSNFLNGYIKMLSELQPKVDPKVNENASGLKLEKFILDPEYAKKWQEHSTDFLILTLNGEIVDNTLYRIGGFGKPKFNKGEYSMLLKYNESLYSEETCRACDKLKPNQKVDIAKRRHLASVWVIIDDRGQIKVEATGTFNRINTVDNSRLYTSDSYMYDCETGFCFGRYSNYFTSKEFVFLDVGYDNDKEKCGVYKINKLDGKYEFFKK